TGSGCASGDSLVPSHLGNSDVRGPRLIGHTTVAHASPATGWRGPVGPVAHPGEPWYCQYRPVPATRECGHAQWFRRTAAGHDDMVTVPVFSTALLMTVTVPSAMFYKAQRYFELTKP